MIVFVSTDSGEVVVEAADSLADREHLAEWMLWVGNQQGFLRRRGKPAPGWLLNLAVRLHEVARARGFASGEVRRCQEVSRTGSAVAEVGGKGHGRAMEPEMLTTDAVAERLGVSRSTVQRLKSRGELPGRKIGRAVRFRAADVDAYLDDGDDT